MCWSACAWQFYWGSICFSSITWVLLYCRRQLSAFIETTDAETHDVRSKIKTRGFGRVIVVWIFDQNFTWIENPSSPLVTSYTASYRFRKLYFLSVSARDVYAFRNSHTKPKDCILRVISFICKPGFINDVLIYSTALNAYRFRFWFEFATSSDQALNLTAAYFNCHILTEIYPTGALFHSIDGVDFSFH